MTLTHYTDKFSNLNMDTKGGYKRPHKVCLLLAVMELIEIGEIPPTGLNLMHNSEPHLPDMAGLYCPWARAFDYL